MHALSAARVTCWHLDRGLHVHLSPAGGWPLWAKPVGVPRARGQGGSVDSARRTDTMRRHAWSMLAHCAPGVRIEQVLRSSLKPVCSASSTTHSKPCAFGPSYQARGFPPTAQLRACLGGTTSLRGWRNAYTIAGRYGGVCSAGIGSYPSTGTCTQKRRNAHAL